MPASDQAERPNLSLRVGISGQRNLSADQRAFIGRQLHDVLMVIGEVMQRLAVDETVRSTYAHTDDQPPQARCRMISPLALGADRLAARAALDLGYSLFVPMPFAKEEYERDFDTPEDLADFQELYARATEGSLALDGAHGDMGNGSYEAVGRLVVRQSDILIAVWDGRPAKGRGGTAEIIRFAAAARIPVIWIYSDVERAPQWIGEMLDLTHPPETGIAFETAVDAYLTKLIVPPPVAHAHKNTIIDWSAHLIKRIMNQLHVPPHERHFLEAKQPSRPFWRAYAILMSLFAGKSEPWKAPSVPSDPVARYWYERYLPPNDRAGETAERYRSSYVLVFLLGTLSLVFGATELLLGLFTPAPSAESLVSRSTSVLVTAGNIGLAGCELLCLALIILLVVAVKCHDWHEKSIEYRLLAELYRKQQALAPLGWSLPITAVRNLVSDTGNEAHDRAAWVGWLFSAEQRAAPLPTGDLAKTARGLPLTAIETDLIEGQLAYHGGREKMAERASTSLERWGGRVFIALFICTSMKFLISFLGGEVHWSLLFGWLATVLPGISAALVGIRAYSELQLLASQSRHMVADLRRAQSRVLRLKMTKPLASQDLGYEAAAVATIMLQDLDGWARLFRLKGAEVS
jgi:hypothetical protein